MNKAQYEKSNYKSEVKQLVQQVDSLRKDPETPIDISIGEFVKKRYGVSMDSYYEDLGINPSIDTISNIFTLPDYSMRWLIPEIIRDALRLGLRKSPIWADLIAAEQTITNPQVTIPHINMSNATPANVGEAETIPLGDVSFGEKTLRVSKLGRGLRIPYEVNQYVSINVMSIFLQDFGIKLNHGIDALMISVLLNGEQNDGSESSPVVGVATPGTFVYRDLLTIWIRMSRMGRQPTNILGGENAAIDTWHLPEFRDRQQGTSESNLNLKTPVPQGVNYYIHGSMPADQQLLIDSSSTIIKYNAQPLLVENDRIVSNQTLETYASLTTGFGILYRDARIVIDSTLDFATNGFPAYMDVDALEQVSFDN